MMHIRSMSQRMLRRSREVLARVEMCLLDVTCCVHALEGIIRDTYDASAGRRGRREGKCGGLVLTLLWLSYVYSRWEIGMPDW